MGKTKVNNSWHDLMSTHVKVNGEWRNVLGTWVKVNGVWKLIATSSPTDIPTLFSTTNFGR
jgi:hypothetical protein